MLATQIIPAAICESVAASGLMASGNRETEITKNSKGLSTLEGLRRATRRSRLSVFI